MTLTKPTVPRRRRSLGELRARRGFSILEMLVVVVLVGIIMSMAGLRVTNMITQQRVVRAAGTVQTDLELAFAAAGRNRAPTKIVFSSSSSAILLRVTDRTGSTEYKRTDFKQLGLSNGDVTVSNAAVTVFPNGFADGTLTVTISVTKNGVLYKRVVSMTRAGLVKVT